METSSQKTKIVRGWRIQGIHLDLQELVCIVVHLKLAMGSPLPVQVIFKGWESQVLVRMELQAKSPLKLDLISLSVALWWTVAADKFQSCPRTNVLLKVEAELRLFPGDR